MEKWQHEGGETGNSTRHRFNCLFSGGICGRGGEKHIADYVINAEMPLRGMWHVASLRLPFVACNQLGSNNNLRTRGICFLSIRTYCRQWNLLLLFVSLCSWLPKWSAAFEGCTPVARENWENLTNTLMVPFQMRFKFKKQFTKNSNPNRSIMSLKKAAQVPRRESWGTCKFGLIVGDILTRQKSSNCQGADKYFDISASPRTLSMRSVHLMPGPAAPASAPAPADRHSPKRG